MRIKFNPINTPFGYPVEIPLFLSPFSVFISLHLSFLAAALVAFYANILIFWCKQFLLFFINIESVFFSPIKRPHMSRRMLYVALFFFKASPFEAIPQICS